MLRLENVHAGYGDTTVLRGVDLAVPNGSVVALLGANGAGKTTLLKTAAGLLRPTEGRVLLDERPVQAQPAHRRTKGGLCLIPEGRGVFPRLSVRENIAMFAGGHRVGDAIGVVGEMFPVLQQRLDQTAGTMSGGEQQMLAVSRALVTEPAVVLADELSLGLAPVIVDRLFEVMGELARRGVAMLIVEQYVDRVLAMAEYVYILHKGRVAFVGEPAQCRGGRIFEQYVGGAA